MSSEQVAGLSAGAVVVAPEPYDSPVAERFVAALEADMVERYDVDVTAPGYEGEESQYWMVRAEQVTPPAGAFLVARSTAGRWARGPCGGSRAARPRRRGQAHVGSSPRRGGGA